MLVIAVHDLVCWQAYRDWRVRLDPVQESVRELVERRDQLMQRYWVERRTERLARAEADGRDDRETAALIRATAAVVGKRRRTAVSPLAVYIIDVFEDGI